MHSYAVYATPLLLLPLLPVWCCGDALTLSPVWYHSRYRCHFTCYARWGGGSSSTSAQSMWVCCYIPLRITGACLSEFEFCADAPCYDPSCALHAPPICVRVCMCARACVPCTCLIVFRRVAPLVMVMVLAMVIVFAVAIVTASASELLRRGCRGVEKHALWRWNDAVGGSR